MEPAVRNGAKGMGFWAVLLVIFIVLKLTEQVTWAWYWVLLPIWFPMAFYVVVMAIAFTIEYFFHRD